MQDIRWRQRYSSFLKTLENMEIFFQKEKLNDLERQGLVKAFEYTFELCWNTLKDYYEYQGESNLQGSRDVYQLAFQRGLITDGELWMQMVFDRNRTTRIYYQVIAQEISTRICNQYYNLFKQVKERLGIQK